jgi:hypothetical protein
MGWVLSAGVDRGDAEQMGRNHALNVHARVFMGLNSPRHDRFRGFDRSAQQGNGKTRQLDDDQRRESE